MKTLAWFVILGSLGGIAFFCWRAYGNWQARKRSEAERFAAFMGISRQKDIPVAPPPVASTLQIEKLLFEAASKAAEAGEPALAAQLYGRLLERFPASSFAEQARTAIRAPDRAGRG